MKTKTSKNAALLRISLLIPIVAMLFLGFTESKIIPVHAETTIENTSFDTNPLQRSVELVGVIVDSETLQPLVDVELFNSKGNLLSKTDNKGYYKIEFNDLKEGELKFEFKLIKKGYQSTVHKEHWGNLQGKIKKNYYLGLPKKGSESSEFSLFIPNNDFSNDAIDENLNSIKTQLIFDKKIEKAKKDNQNSFIKIENQNYIVSNTGWIKINSKNDLVSINDNQIIPVFKINKVINRKDITGMTPINNAKAQFAIYTVPVDNAVRPFKNPKNQRDYTKSSPTDSTRNPIEEIIKNQDIYDELDKSILFASFPKINIKPDKKFSFYRSINDTIIKIEGNADSFESFSYKNDSVMSSSNPKAPFSTMLYTSDKAPKTENQIKKNPKTGFLEVNGQTLFYTSINGETTYYNRWGQIVNRNGKIINPEQTKAEEVIEGQVISKVYKDDNVVAEFYTDDTSTPSSLPTKKSEVKTYPKPIKFSPNKKRNDILVNGKSEKVFEMTIAEIKEIKLSSTAGKIVSFKIKIPLQPTRTIKSNMIDISIKNLISEAKPNMAIAIFNVKIANSNKKSNPIIIKVKP